MTKHIEHEGLTYDDVLIKPGFSTINSRSYVNLDGLFGEHPIIPANMSTCCGEEMADFILSTKGTAILHRYMPDEEYFRLAKKYNNKVLYSVGSIYNEKERICKLLKLGITEFCVDLAHGHSTNCGLTVTFIRDNCKHAMIIGGNVATLDGAIYLKSCGADIVKIGVGPGCFAAGTRILMSNGYYKNIQEVRPGDRIINKDGVPCTVKNSFSTGVRNVMSVRHVYSINKTYLTPDHNCFVGDLSSTSKKTGASRGYSKVLLAESKTIPKQSKLKWKQVQHTKNDVFLLPKNIKFEIKDGFIVNLINYNKAKNYEKYNRDVIPSYSLGYIFGTFLGDGSANLPIYKTNQRGQVTWYFGLNEYFIATKLVECLNNVFKLQATITKRKSVYLVSCYSKPLAHLLHEFGSHENKHLPENYWCNNKEYLTGLYDGLVDSDGHVSDRVAFSNTSPRLIELYFILNYILNGYFPNISHRGPSAGGLKNCNVANCLPSFVAKQNIKPNYRDLDNKYSIVKPLEFTDSLIATKVYDLEIDDPTHSFIADNMIVHNSVCTTRTQTGVGVPQLTALLECSKANIPLIADGGFKCPGDIAKALAIDNVEGIMTGSFFAGTDKTPGWKEHGQSVYAGMASKAVQQEFKGEAKNIEGEAYTVNCLSKGSTENTLNSLLESLRSSLSYVGARNLRDFKEFAILTRVSSHTTIENNPHFKLWKR